MNYIVDLSRLTNAYEGKVLTTESLVSLRSKALFECKEEHRFNCSVGNALILGKWCSRCSSKYEDIFMPRRAIRTCTQLLTGIKSDELDSTLPNDVCFISNDKKFFISYIPSGSNSYDAMTYANKIKYKAIVVQHSVCKWGISQILKDLYTKLQSIKIELMSDDDPLESFNDKKWNMIYRSIYCNDRKEMRPTKSIKMSREVSNDSSDSNNSIDGDNDIDGADDGDNYIDGAYSANDVDAVDGSNDEVIDIDTSKYKAETPQSIVLTLFPNEGRDVAKCKHSKSFNRGLNLCTSCRQESAFFNEIKKNGNRNLELYDLSKSVYWSATRDIDMYCKEHGLFKVTPSNFIDGVGCDKCITLVQAE